MPEKKKTDKSWYKIEMAKSGDDENSAKILIYDEIGENFWGEGVSAKKFVKDLQSLDVEQIDLHINSPGGNVFDGNAIYNSLRVHKANIDVSIDGIAASAASVVAMAGDRIKMPQNAMMMIHNPAGLVWGTAAEMIKMADTLDKIKVGVIAAYGRKSGQGKENLSKMMDDETWMTADEALDMGFADEVTDKVTIQNSFDLSKFKNAPNMIFEGVGLDSFSNTSDSFSIQTDDDDSNSLKGGNVMPNINIEMIEKDHPEIFKAIYDRGFEAGLGDGEITGAAEENKRVKDILEISVKGYEDFVLEMALDPEISLSDAQKKLIDKIKENADLTLKKHLKDAPDPVDDIKIEGKDKKVDPNLPFDERVKMEWENDAEVREEFGGDFEAFVAYMKHDEAGNIKIITKESQDE